MGISPITYVAKMQRREQGLTMLYLLLYYSFFQYVKTKTTITVNNEGKEERLDSKIIMFNSIITGKINKSILNFHGDHNIYKQNRAFF